MRQLLHPFPGVETSLGAFSVEGDLDRWTRRFECKLRRFLAAVPLPAKDLSRRRIAQSLAVQVHAAHHLRHNVQYVHGVSVLRLAKMPHVFPALPERLDLEQWVRDAGDRPASETPDPELRTATDHLLQQTLSYLKENAKRVVPATPLEPGLRADVQIDALNFYHPGAERVTLIAHVLIELTRSRELESAN
jgi:hypothetical protein